MRLRDKMHARGRTVLMLARYVFVRTKTFIGLQTMITETATGQYLHKTVAYDLSNCDKSIS